MAAIKIFEMNLLIHLHKNFVIAFMQKSSFIPLFLRVLFIL